MALTPPPSGPPAAPPLPGEAPSRANPSTFRELADAFVVWQVGFRDWLAGMVAWLAGYISWASTNVTEMGALQTDVQGNANTSATAASSAAASAAAVQANRTALDNRLYPGTYSADPVTRPDGSAVQAGDRYFNTSIARQKTYSGTVWATDNLDSAALAGGSGSSLIGYLPAGVGAVPQTVEGVLRQSLSLWSYMTDAEKADAQNPAGPTNNMHSAAFAKAFAAAVLLGAKRVWIPPVLGAYSVRDVDVPLGLTLCGFRQPVYNPASVADVRGTGSVIVQATGGTNLFRWTGASTAKGLCLYGNAQTADCFQTVSGRIGQMHIVDCGIYNFSRGVGNTAYMGSTRVFRCNIAANVKGVAGLVDSQVYGNIINANTAQGVDQQSGANDTFFVANKIEWNLQEGLRFFSAAHSVVSDNIIDRNGRAGLKVTGTSQVAVGVNYMRRNGALILGDPECAHIYAEAGTLTVGAIQTQTGANDDGSGSTTPNYGVSLGTVLAEFTMTGGSLTGVVTQGLRYGSTGATVPTACKVLGVLGTEDKVNTGLTQVDLGRQYICRSSDTAGSGLLAPAASYSFPCVLAPNGTNLQRDYTLKIEARNTNTANPDIGAKALIRVQRDAGSAAIRVVGQIYGWTIPTGAPTTLATAIGDTSGATFQLTFSAVAADASTFTLTVTNNSATETYQALATLDFE